MNRLLVHAVALACAALSTALFYAALRPTWVEALTIFAALNVVGLGLCAARRNVAALVPAALAAAGLLLIGFSLPASAATAHKIPALSVIEAPVQPLALAAPSAPQQVVVKVAPSDAAVSAPVSDWIANTRNVVITLLLALWARVSVKLPGPVLWLVRLYGERKIIEWAVDFGINAVPGAAKGAPLTFDVGSPVLAHALQWVVDNVPTLIVKLMGGEDGIRAKIFAALHLEPDASAAAYGVKVSA